MSETDWRHILRMSEKELTKSEKDELCESISWMEADDIELNFSDLKSLFRLSQDILKYKSEQVKNLQGQLEVKRRKSFRKRSTTITNDEVSQGSDLNLETISQQEDAIKKNKEKIDMLTAEIAELEEQRSNIEKTADGKDRDSESSRDPLSELDAVEQLEREVVTKNRHLKKLLSDIKAQDDENNQLKNKITILKDKLSESTQVIENLTEQMFTLNKESSKFKEALGKSQERNSHYLLEIDALKQQILEGDAEKNVTVEDLRNKILHWKNVVRCKKTENESLSNKNMELSTSLAEIGARDSINKQDHTQEHHVTLLQDRLTEATNDILESAKCIEKLKTEIKQLKAHSLEIPDYSTLSEMKEDKSHEEKTVFKLKKTNYSLTNNIKEANNIINLREKELSDVRSELIILQSNNEGIKTLADDLKSKTRQLKIKDDKIKSFVQEINTINKLVDNLQLENASMRKKLNISPNTKIPATGTLKKIKIMEAKIVESNKILHDLENRNINLELEKRNHEMIIKCLKTKLFEMGCLENELNNILSAESYLDNNGEEDFKRYETGNMVNENNVETNPIYQTEIKTLSEENEGLRKGLQEILDFLKESGTETGSSLALQCPSLEAVLRCMEARHAAGWFAPHMAVVLELRAALGGRDALHTALNNARKETLEVMSQLKDECKKTEELETKLNESDLPRKIFETEDEKENESEGIFGTWIDENNIIDFTDKGEIGNVIANKNNAYEVQLKCGLNYFQKKFISLYKLLTELEINSSDNNSKWLIKEENYKAEIERLKIQNHGDGDDSSSDISPGIVKYYSDPNILHRKCSYLEESYKYIRTLNENIKNEYLDFKLEVIESNTEYENKIQILLLKVISLTDKLRSSICLDTFLKQNKILYDISMKYRKLTENNVSKNNNICLLNKMEEQRLNIVNRFRREIQNHNVSDIDKHINVIDHNMLQKQLEVICAALEESKIQTQKLENKFEEFHVLQNNFIDSNLQSANKEEFTLEKEKSGKLLIENQALKDQCQHVTSQLNIALLQLQQQQSKQIDNDMEINLLRHQILDLQSTGDNKAIIARLSGEIIISQLQALESHKKIEKLQNSLNKEKRNRVETEEILKSREKIFSVYSTRYKNKFRYLLDITNILRLQYHGALPIISLENYLNNLEDLSRKNIAVDEKLNEIEDVGALLIAKHEVYDEFLQLNKVQCALDEDKCPHNLQSKINESIFKRELKHYNKKMETLEKSRREAIERCNFLEKTLIFINQNNHNMPFDKLIKHCNEEISELELEDINSDEENISRKSETITLPKPKILKPIDNNEANMIKSCNDSIHIVNNIPSNSLQLKKEVKNYVSVLIQTDLYSIYSTKNKNTQTVTDKVMSDYEKQIKELTIQNKSLEKQIAVYSNDSKHNLQLDKLKTKELSDLGAKNSELEIKVRVLENSIAIKDDLNKKLQDNLSHINTQLLDYKSSEKNKLNASVEETKSLFEVIKRLELDKQSIIEEYKLMLTKEREEFANNIKETQSKIFELQTQLSRKGSDSTNGESFKEIVSKYTVKIVQLEDQKFKLQSDLDGCKTELSTYESELERWKSLAAERLNKMEQLNFQLEKRHSQEVDSYKAENQHWAFQAAEAQREQAELRGRLAEQRTAHLKLIAEKDAHIDRLRNVVHNLKTQVLNMQTLISVNDPSFDLSAIVEVDESSDVLSQPSDRLELKFDSTMELEEYQDETAKIPASSSSIWQDNIIDRLRREKQLVVKQNSILRRQIKALAGRERRSRLETQNLKNQVYRISTSGSKTATAESAVLQNKIANLQAQLSTARRDTQSSVALWDKWKRAQQASERWQARFEEKCREVKKFEGSLNFTKSALTRLEREKRVLLSKVSLSQSKLDVLSAEERDHSYERREEKATDDSIENEKDCGLASKVSIRALMERVEAQQRRIAALELADRGNEPLVSEYEKSLAEITSLKGQILRLESSVLENQLRSPGLNTPDHRPELDYWKSYCDMLKEENMQLSVKLSTVEATPGTPQQQRVNQLEQTVLTLRGLVSKMQSEQKSGAQRRGDSPQLTLDRSLVDKNKSQLERNEISNLKKTIIDKDNLLERSKEMLKMAAEREEDLLKENTYLRHRLNELTTAKTGFLSA